MTTPTVTRLAPTAPAAPTAPTAPAARVAATPPRAVSTASPLSAAVLEASDAVGQVDLADPAWVEAGPLLTAFVDAARRAVGIAGSPIGPDEDVPPVLRLRDLARLATRIASSAGTAATTTPQVVSCLRSLQSAAGRCPLG